MQAHNLLLARHYTERPDLSYDSKVVTCPGSALMRQTSGPTKKAPAEAVLKDIRRATRRQFSAEEKIRIVLEGPRGEDSIAELCRREGISSMHYGWPAEFLEAGKKKSFDRDLSVERCIPFPRR